MLTILYSTSPEYEAMLAKWVTDKLFMRRLLRIGDYSTLAVMKVDPATSKSEIIAGVLFHDKMPMGDKGKIEVSMAATDPKWAQPGIIRAILHYAFIQQNCHVLVATTTKNNQRTRRFLTGIGFKEKGSIPNRPYADDTIIYSLRVEDADRYLNRSIRKAA